MRKIYITESQFNRIVSKQVSEDAFGFQDMSYEEVAKKVWAGEIQPIESIHDPKEQIKHCGNVMGQTPIDVYGRLFRGLETNKVYFLEL